MATTQVTTTPLMLVRALAVKHYDKLLLGNRTYRQPQNYDPTYHPTLVSKQLSDAVD